MWCMYMWHVCVSICGVGGACVYVVCVCIFVVFICGVFVYLCLFAFET